MSAIDGLKFTIYDSSGQALFYNDIKMPSGTIITEEMLEGTALEGEFGADTIDTSVDLNNIDINSAPGMALSEAVTSAILQYLEVTIQSLIAGGTASLMNNLGINQENLEMANYVLNIMNNAVFSINSILKFVPKHIHMVPTAKAAMSSICTSLKDMYDAIYLSIEQLYYETIGDAITNLPNTLEILKDSLELLLQLALLMIDELCIKYTGYTLIELYYMCNSVIGLYKRYKEVRLMQKNGYEVSIDTSIDSDAIKNLLFEELAKSSDLIYNAFFILEIRDSINNIMDLVKQFNNVDLSVLNDGIDSFEDFMDLMVEMGIDLKSNTVTLSEAIKLGINNFQNNFNALTELLTTLALLSTAVMATTIKENINVSLNATKVFDFDNDPENFLITLNIYQDPTTNSVKKNITNALTKATNTNGLSTFTGAEVLSIINAIQEGYNDKKDKMLSLTYINFKIHFQINGFNLSDSSKVENIYDTVDNLLNNYNKELLNINLLPSYELGVVVEEYTTDPVQAVRRPTLDFIHELYGILTEFFPLLKIFATLVSNYKINKAKVENNCSGNLFGMVKVLAKINKLLKKVNKKDKNFYTIRSLKLYDYVTTSITPLDGINEKEIDLDDTRKLSLYLNTIGQSNEQLSSDKYTLLYIDQDSLEELRKQLDDAYNKAADYFGDNASLFINYPESKYADGTLLGLDKVEDVGDEIYYSDSSLPLYGSLILRCYSRDYDVSI